MISPGISCSRNRTSRSLLAHCQLYWAVSPDIAVGWVDSVAVQVILYSFFMPFYSPTQHKTVIRNDNFSGSMNPGGDLFGGMLLNNDSAELCRTHGAIWKGKKRGKLSNYQSVRSIKLKTFERNFKHQQIYAEKLGIAGGRLCSWMTFLLAK